MQISAMITLWRNLKNKTIYEKLYEAVDCTNSREGTLVVIYRIHEMFSGQIWARDKEEFLKKFIEYKGEENESAC